MSHRILAVTLTIGVFPWLTSWPVANQTAATQESDAETPQRTPWGDPDLQGAWNFTVDTPLNRQTEFGERAVLTEEEVAQRAHASAQVRFDLDNLGPATRTDPGELNRPGYNRFWTDSRRTSGQTSLVVDPPDGRVPPLIAEAMEWHAEQQVIRRGVTMDAPTPGGFVEDLGPRGLFTRCILGFNSGPPMVPTLYNANVQIVQTPDLVALFNEMVHSVRMVPLNGRPHLSRDIRQWMGDSRGRWEDDTLVVTTTNFTDQVFDPYPSPGRSDAPDPTLLPAERVEMLGGGMRPRGTGLILVERFTRTSADTLRYQFTMNDPAWYTAAWTAQLPMVRSNGPLYEYACHEGNHSLVNILAGAR